MKWRIPSVLLTVVFSFVLALTFSVRSPTFGSEDTNAKLSGEIGAANRQAVVVELFTSEGCSSCPPADKVLTWLNDNQPLPGVEIIPLSEHVDYWNHLGWADPYSSASFTERQREYSQSLRAGVYTPQMVVDGKVQFLGSDRDEALEAISHASQMSKATIRIQPIAALNSSAPNSVSFSVQAGNIPLIGAKEKGLVFLAITENNLQTNVAGGENSGRNLRYSAVVRELKMIGRLDARPDASFLARPTVRISREWKRNDLRAVVFIELQGSHKILGAAESLFPAS
ncbi:MAG: DUF1223 domain-containing protein [Terriglobia bacterium]